MPQLSISRGNQSVILGLEEPQDMVNFSSLFLSLSHIVSSVVPSSVASTLVLCLLLLTVSWMKYLFHSLFYDMSLERVAKSA